MSRPRTRPTASQKSGSHENRTRDHWICSQELRPLDHRGGLAHPFTYINLSNAMPLYREHSPSPSELQRGRCRGVSTELWPRWKQDNGIFRRDFTRQPLGCNFLRMLTFLTQYVDQNGETERLNLPSSTDAVEILLSASNLGQGNFCNI
jgi:hypothetical protein